MTLIIGLKCKNGLIMAADSMSTETAPGGGGIAKHESDKLVIHKNLLWGSSGSVGVKQAVQEAIQQGYDKISNHNLSPVAVRQKLIDLIHPITVRSYKQASEQHASCNLTGRLPLPHTNFIFAIYTQQDFHLINIEWDMGGEVCDAKHCSTGSGMKTGQALLRRLRKHDWTLDVGAVVAYRTMNDAIHVEPSGIGPPIKLARYQRAPNNKDMLIEVISPAEMKQIESAAEAWMGVEQDTLAALDPAAIQAADVPPPPPPPQAA